MSNYQLKDEKNHSKETFYLLLSRLFPTSKKAENSFTLLFETFLNIFTFIQLSTLTLNENTFESSSAKSKKMMKIVTYSRIENIFSELGILKVFIYILISKLLLIFTGLVVLYLGILLKKPYSENCFRPFRFLIGVMSTFLSIPTLNVLFHMVFFHFRQESPGPEYNFEISTEMAFLSLFALSVHLLINAIWVFYNLNVRHSDMNGKAYASLDVLSLTINFMTVFLHVTLFEISSELFYGISSVLHTFSAASYIFYMPYFKQRTNFTKSALHSSVVCMIFIITVASYTSKGFFLLLGFLTLLPAHLTFVHHLLVKREEYLKSLNMEDLNSEFQFELFFRFKLEKTSEPESLMTVFSRFSENFHSKVSNLYYVWLAYFCLDYMKDERLALVKLTQTKFSKSSLSGDFEIFKCQAMIGDINLKYKDLAQVQCSMNLEKIIKYEGRFFEEFLYFLQIISKPSVYSPQVRKQVEVVNVLMKKLNEKYNEFIKLFPEFFQTLSNYPEFVKKIVGDEKKAKLLVSQQEYLKDKNSESFFSHNIGIVLISAELKDIGQILFANRIAFDLLGTSSTHLLGRSINDFVPKPFDRNHNFYLARHSTSCSDVHLSFPEEFIILNEQGFLMEVNLNIFMASVNTQNVYVMKFKKRDRRREIAIVDLSGNIFSHSELFGYYLGIQAKFLGNVNIKNVLEDLDLEKLRNERFLLYQLKRLTVAFMLIEITFRTRPIYLFIISENLNSPFTNDKSEVQKKVFFDSEVINLNNEEEFCRLSDVELSQKEEIKVDYGVSGKEETFDLLSNEKNDESTKLRVALTISEGLKRKSELNISIVSTIIEKNEVRTENLEVVYAKFSPDQEKLNQVLNSIKKKYFTLQVLTIVVAVIILICVIVFLALLNRYLKLESNYQALDSLSEVLYEISNVPSLCRLLQLSLINTVAFNQTFLINNFQTALDNLSELKQIISDNQEMYSKCPSFSQLYENQLNLNNLEKNTKKTNLVNLLNLFIHHGQNFLEEVQTGSFSIKHSSFLIENSIGSVSHQLNETLEASVECLNNLSGFIDSLIFYSCGVVGLSILVLVLITIPVIKSLKTSIDELSIKKNIYLRKASPNLINFCIDQLQSKGILEEQQEGSSDFQVKKPKFFIYYFFMIMVNVMFSGVIIFVCYYEGKIISDMILNGPAVKLNLATRRFIYHQMMFYTSESYIKSNNLTNIFQNYNFSMISYPDKHILEEFSAEQKILLNIARGQKMKKYNSAKSNEIQFHYFNGKDPVFTIGTTSAGRSILYDMYLVYGANNSKFKIFALANEKITCLSSFIFNIYKKLNNLEEILEELILDFKPFFFSIIFSEYYKMIKILSTVLLVFLFYSLYIEHKLLEKEKKYFETVSLMITIMINNQL